MVTGSWGIRRVPSRWSLTLAVGLLSASSASAAPDRWGIDGLVGEAWPGTSFVGASGRVGWQWGRFTLTGDLAAGTSLDGVQTEAQSTNFVLAGASVEVPLGRQFTASFGPRLGWMSLSGAVPGTPTSAVQFPSLGIWPGWTSAVTQGRVGALDLRLTFRPHDRVEGKVRSGLGLGLDVLAFASPASALGVGGIEQTWGPSPSIAATVAGLMASLTVGFDVLPDAGPGDEEPAPVISGAPPPTPNHWGLFSVLGHVLTAGTVLGLGVRGDLNSELEHLVAEASFAYGPGPLGHGGGHQVALLTLGASYETTLAPHLRAALGPVIGVGEWQQFWRKPSQGGAITASGAAVDLQTLPGLDLRLTWLQHTKASGVPASGLAIGLDLKVLLALRARFGGAPMVFDPEDQGVPGVAVAVVPTVTVGYEHF